MRRPIDMRGRRAAGGALPPAGALYLDGVNDYLSVDDNDLLDTFAGNKFTLVGMVRLAAWPGAGVYQTIAGKIVLAGASSYLSLAGNFIGGDPDEATSMLSSAAVRRLGRYSNPPIDRWVQWALVYDGSLTAANRLKTACNTAPLVSVTAGGDVPTSVTASTAKLILGAAANGAGVASLFCNASYANWRLYPDALTETQLATLALGGEVAGDVLRLRLRSEPVRDESGNALVVTEVGGAAIVRPRPTTWPTQIVRVHTLGDSRMLGLDDVFDGTGVTTRGGLRRHLGNYLADLGIMMRGVGSLKAQGGWAHEHDAISGAVVSVIATHADGSAYTPDYVLWYAGLNDSRTGPTLYGPQTRADTLAAFDSIYASQSPKTIVIVEPHFIGGYGVRYEEREHGLAEWQRNVLGFTQRALGRDVREYARDWVIADVAPGGVDLSGGAHLHPYDACYESIGSALATMVHTWPVAPTLAPYQIDLATLQSALGSKLKLVYDMRSPPTEASGLVTTRPDLIGSNHATGDTTAPASKPRWMGGSDEFSQGIDGEGTLPMYAIAPAVIVSGACVFGVRFVEYAANQSWGTYPSGHTCLFMGGHNTDTSFIVYLCCPDATHTELHVHAKTGVAKNTSIKCAITSDLLPHNVTVEYNNGDADDPASYVVRLDGVTKTMSAGGKPWGATARGEGGIGGRAHTYDALYGATRKHFVASSLTAGELAVVDSWMSAELGVPA